MSKEAFGKRNLIGGLVAVTSATFYSLCGVFVKLSTDINPSIHTLSRSIFILVLTLTSSPFIGFKVFAYTLKSYALLTIIGILNTLVRFLENIVFQKIPLSDAFTIISCSPIFVVVIDFVFYRKSISKLDFVMILSCLTGVILCSKPDFIFQPSKLTFGFHSTGNAYALALLIGALRGLIFCIIKYLQHVDSLTFLISENTIGVLFMSFYIYFFSGFDVLGKSLSDYLCLAGNSLASLFATVFLYLSLRVGSALMTSIGRCFEIPMSILFTVVIFKNGYDWMNVCGAVLVMASMLIPNLLIFRRQKYEDL